MVSLVEIVQYKLFHLLLFVSHNQMTALEVAMERGHVKIIKILRGDVSIGNYTTNGCVSLITSPIIQIMTQCIITTHITKPKQKLMLMHRKRRRHKNEHMNKERRRCTT